MIKKTLFLSFGLLWLAPAGYAQGIQLCDGAAQPDSGQVQVLADKRIAELIRTEVLMAGSEPTLPGYRVQVYSGKSREEAEKLKSFLEVAYPGYPVYLVYESPYFKVRMGDFRGKMESQYLLHEMKERYSSVLLVQDKINFPKVD